MPRPARARCAALNIEFQKRAPPRHRGNYYACGHREPRTNNPELQIERERKIEKGDQGKEREGTFLHPFIARCAAFAIAGQIRTAGSRWMAETSKRRNVTSKIHHSSLPVRFASPVVPLSCTFFSPPPPALRSSPHARSSGFYESPGCVYLRSSPYSDRVSATRDYRAFVDDLSSPLPPPPPPPPPAEHRRMTRFRVARFPANAFSVRWRAVTRWRACQRGDRQRESQIWERVLRARVRISTPPSATTGAISRLNTACMHAGGGGGGGGGGQSPAKRNETSNKVLGAILYPLPSSIRGRFHPALDRADCAVMAHKTVNLARF